MTSEETPNERRDSRPPDLVREREALLQGILPGGRIEEAVREFQLLRKRVSDLEAENTRLLAQIEADDAIRSLVKKIDALEAEKQALLSRVRGVEAENHESSARFSQVEAEFSNMANLFVASSQIHSTLTPARVCRRLKEVLAQLVGAERFAIYLLDGETEQMVPVASEGLLKTELSPFSPEGPGLGEHLRSGGYLEEGQNPHLGTFERPAAVLPLSIDETAAGAIVVVSTLSQKTEFTPLDFELFKLLRQHAAGALVSADIFLRMGRKLPDLGAFSDLNV